MRWSVWLGALVLIGAVAGACGPTVRRANVTADPPDRYLGRVVSSSGPTVVRTGDECAVHVQRADGQSLNCRIRVHCHGDTVYGLPDAGFNRCRERGGMLVFAHDKQGTRYDGDPRLFFDLQAGRLIISDDRPDVEILVDLIARPQGYRGAGPDGVTPPAEP